MNLILFLISVSLVKGIELNDEDISEGKYIDLLSEKQKKEFIDNVSRRIHEEVQSANNGQSSLEVSKEQLDQHNEYVSKIFKEESENMRRGSENYSKFDKADDGSESSSNENIKVKGIEKRSNEKAGDVRKSVIDLTLRDGKKNISEANANVTDTTTTEFISASVVVDDKSEMNTSLQSGNNKTAHKDKPVVSLEVDVNGNSLENRTKNSPTHDFRIPVSVVYDDKSWDERNISSDISAKPYTKRPSAHTKKRESVVVTPQLQSELEKEVKKQDITRKVLRNQDNQEHKPSPVINSLENDEEKSREDLESPIKKAEKAEETSLSSVSVTNSTVDLSVGSTTRRPVGYTQEINEFETEEETENPQTKKPKSKTKVPKDSHTSETSTVAITSTTEKSRYTQNIYLEEENSGSQESVTEESVPKPNQELINNITLPEKNSNSTDFAELQNKTKSFLRHTEENTTVAVVDVKISNNTKFGNSSTEANTTTENTSFKIGLNEKAMVSANYNEKLTETNIENVKDHDTLDNGKSATQENMNSSLEAIELNTNRTVTYEKTTFDKGLTLNRNSTETNNVIKARSFVVTMPNLKPEEWAEKPEDNSDAKTTESLAVVPTEEFKNDSVNTTDIRDNGSTTTEATITSTASIEPLTPTMVEYNPETVTKSPVTNTEHNITLQIYNLTEEYTDNVTSNESNAIENSIFNLSFVLKEGSLFDNTDTTEVENTKQIIEMLTLTENRSNEYNVFEVPKGKSPFVPNEKKQKYKPYQIPVYKIEDVNKFESDNVNVKYDKHVVDDSDRRDIGLPLFYESINEDPKNTNDDQPFYVPTYNYDAKHAYYNPKNHLGPNYDDDKPDHVNIKSNEYLNQNDNLKFRDAKQIKPFQYHDKEIGSYENYNEKNNQNNIFWHGEDQQENGPDSKEQQWQYLGKDHWVGSINPISNLKDHSHENNHWNSPAYKENGLETFTYKNKHRFKNNFSKNPIKNNLLSYSLPGNNLSKKKYSYNYKSVEHNLDYSKSDETLLDFELLRNAYKLRGNLDKTPKIANKQLLTEERLRKYKATKNANTKNLKNKKDMHILERGNGYDISHGNPLPLQNNNNDDETWKRLGKLFEDSKATRYAEKLMKYKMKYDKTRPILFKVPEYKKKRDRYKPQIKNNKINSQYIISQFPFRSQYKVDETKNPNSFDPKFEKYYDSKVSFLKDFENQYQSQKNDYNRKFGFLPKNTKPKRPSKDTTEIQLRFPIAAKYPMVNLNVQTTDYLDTDYYFNRKEPTVYGRRKSHKKKFSFPNSGEDDHPNNRIKKKQADSFLAAVRQIFQARNDFRFGSQLPVLRKLDLHTTEKTIIFRSETGDLTENKARKLNMDSDSDVKSIAIDYFFGRSQSDEDNANKIKPEKANPNQNFGSNLIKTNGYLVVKRPYSFDSKMNSKDKYSFQRQNQGNSKKGKNTFKLIQRQGAEYLPDIEPQEILPIIVPEEQDIHPIIVSEEQDIHPIIVPEEQDIHPIIVPEEQTDIQPEIVHDIQPEKIPEDQPKTVPEEQPDIHAETEPKEKPDFQPDIVPEEQPEYPKSEGKPEKVPKDSGMAPGGVQETPPKSADEKGKGKKRSRINIEHMKLLLDMSDPKDVIPTLVELQDLLRNGKSELSSETSELEPFVTVFRDMVKMDISALQNYKWLQSTVDILSAIKKFMLLTNDFRAGLKIHPADLRLLTYTVKLYLKAVDTLNDRSRRSLLLFLQPIHVMDVKVDLDKLKEDIWTMRVKEKKFDRDLLVFRQFLKDLQDGMKDLHGAITNIAMVTKFKSQNWYKNLKELYLSNPTRKNILEIILHLTTHKLIDSLEREASKEHSRTTKKNVKEVGRTVDDFVFLLKVLNEMKRINV